MFSSIEHSDDASAASTLTCQDGRHSFMKVHMKLLGTRVASQVHSGTLIVLGSNKTSSEEFIDMCRAVSWVIMSNATTIFLLPRINPSLWWERNHHTVVLPWI
jgi:hypothetical protein